MREIRPSGSEGGVAHARHPYPYFSFALPGCAQRKAQGVDCVVFVTSP
jgi:hypothetical protein